MSDLGDLASAPATLADAAAAAIQTIDIGDLTAATGANANDQVPAIQDGALKLVGFDLLALGLRGRVINVGTICPTGVNIIDVVGSGGQTPRTLGYSTMAAYIGDLPHEYRASVTSFSLTTLTIDDQTGAIALQTALNYIWDNWGGAAQAAAGAVTWSGRLRINRRIIGNGIGIGVLGDVFGERAGGTILSACDSTNASLWSTSPTVDDQDWMLHLYNYDNFNYISPDRTPQIDISGMPALVKYVSFEGPGNNSLTSAPTCWVSGLRTDATFGSHVHGCTFGNGVIDGWNVTGPSLWVFFTQNRGYGVHRDCFSVLPSTVQTTTTINSHDNYFGAVGRYCNFFGQWTSIGSQSRCFNNIYEQADSSWWWQNHPEAWLQGVKASDGFVDCAGLHRYGNYYEGSAGPGTCDVDVHLLGGGNVDLDNDENLSLIALSAYDPDQDRTNAAIAFSDPWLAVTAVSKASTAHATITSNTLTDGALVRFYIANGGLNGMGQLFGPKFMLKNNTGTGADLWKPDGSAPIDSTAWSTFTGVNTRLTTGERYFDITDQRNFRVTYPGKMGANSFSRVHFKNLGGATVFMPYQMLFDGTDRIVFENVPVTLIGVPTKPAVNNEGHAVVPIAGAVAIYQPTPLDVVFKNCSIDSRILATYENRGKNGSYVTNAGFPGWTASTVVTNLLNSFRQLPMLTPTAANWNGLAYQCVVGGTTGSSEPTWVNAGVAVDVTITGITRGSSVTTITAPGHGFSNGYSVVFAMIEGTTQLNNTMATVTVVDANTFTIPVNSSGYGAYTAQGVVYRVTPDNGVAWRAVLVGAFLSSENLRSERLELGRRVFEATAAPTTGYHEAGTRVMNASAASGDPLFWKCDISGVPGHFIDGPHFP